MIPRQAPKPPRPPKNQRGLKEHEAMKALGIDIGTYSIKVAELEVGSSSRGYSLSNFLEFPLSSDLTKDRGLEIIEILRNLSSQYDPTNTRWVIGLPQHRVSVHHRRFPFRERQKILKSLAFELEDEIPLDIDDTVFDAKITGFAGDAADVLTIASPREVIEEHLTLGKDGGFDPDIISVEGLAMANVFESWNAPPPEISSSLQPHLQPSTRDEEDIAATVPALPPLSRQANAILHIGHSRTLLLVYHESGLIAVRSLLWGGADIAEAIARAFSLPAFEAVKVLQTKSFILMNSAGASRDQLLMSKTVSTCVDSLMQELRLTLLEVKAGFGIEFSQIDLFGGVSQIQNLGAYVTQALEIPANIGRHLQNHRNVRIQTTPQFEAISPVAVGLAIEALKRPRNPPINLRKGEFARENQTLKWFWEKWKTAVQVGAAAFAILVVFAFLREGFAGKLIEVVDERLSEIATKTANLKGSAANVSGVNRYISQQKTLIRNREALMQLDDYTSAMDVLAKLTEKLPVQPPGSGSALDVFKLQINNDDLIIEGRAQGPGMLARVESALKEIARPPTVSKTVATVTPPPGPGTPFAYKIKVNRKP